MREVSEAFFRQCKEQKVDHIFVGGDIFHTKCAGMSPECIEQLCWWFTEMALIAEVHVILGNHDGNLTNKARQDAISPILAALDNPRIHLYKQSGVYEFAPGYVWGVFSLFDEEGWDRVKPVSGKVNIACYHGPIRGAATETDWTVEDGITTEFFQGWDFAFLGDIHERQFLAEREVELEIDESELDDYPDAEVIG